MNSFIDAIAFNFQTSGENFQVLFPKLPQRKFLHLRDENKRKQLFLFDLMIAEVEFFNDGRKSTDGFYNQMGKNGISTQWYINSHLKVVEFFKNGVREGISTSYHSNGVINNILNYKNNKVDGEAEGNQIGIWNFYTRN
jgi:antitoxin component YwqK of YwqJK toxin-antitoxin module